MNSKRSQKNQTKSQTKYLNQQNNSTFKENTIYLNQQNNFPHSKKILFICERVWCMCERMSMTPLYLFRYFINMTKYS